MLQQIPELLPRLIGVLADRIREYSRAEQQRDKLSALGKLSAGLAHELNNPASAAGRAAEGLRDYMRELRRVNKTLDDAALTFDERALVVTIEEKLLGQMASAPPLSKISLTAWRRNCAAISSFFRKSWPAGLGRFARWLNSQLTRSISSSGVNAS